MFQANNSKSLSRSFVVTFFVVAGPANLGSVQDLGAAMTQLMTGEAATVAVLAGLLASLLVPVTSSARKPNQT